MKGTGVGEEIPENQDPTQHQPQDQGLDEATTGKASRSSVPSPKGELKKFNLDSNPTATRSARFSQSLLPWATSRKRKGSSEMEKDVSTTATNGLAPSGPFTLSRGDTVATISSTASTSSAAKKARRPSSKYAPPSKYAHLPYLTDRIEPDLICLFVGLNPGIRTATTGHAYSHPSNLFWKLLHSSGCTPRRCRPTEDQDLPSLYSLGNTNIVARPTKDQAELTRDEMEEGVAILEEKVRKWRPEAVCLVGKAIWESVWKAKYGRKIKAGEFSYGWQDSKHNLGKSLQGHGRNEHVRVRGGEMKQENDDDDDDDDHKDKKGRVEWKGARIFVATTTSGLAATLRPAEKEAVWKPLGDWVKGRREDREAAELLVSKEMEKKKKKKKVDDEGIEGETGRNGEVEGEMEEGERERNRGEIK